MHKKCKEKCMKSDKNNLNTSIAKTVIGQHFQLEDKNQAKINLAGFT